MPFSEGPRKCLQIISLNPVFCWISTIKMALLWNVYNTTQLNIKCLRMLSLISPNLMVLLMPPFPLPLPLKLPAAVVNKNNYDRPMKRPWYERNTWVFMFSFSFFFLIVFIPLTFSFSHLLFCVSSFCCPFFVFVFRFYVSFKC